MLKFDWEAREMEMTENDGRVDCGWKVVDFPSFETVASFWSSEFGPSEEHYARLIAAAPDLLKACEAAFAFVESIPGISPVTIPNEAGLWIQLSDAIAKAKGNK